MKAFHNSSFTLAAAVMSAVLGVVLAAAAQSEGDRVSGKTETPTGQPERVRRPQPNPAGAGRFGAGFERFFGILTEEQRASLREATTAEDREKLRELEGKVREARKALFESGLVDKFDEAAVRQKAMAAASLEAEITVLRVKVFSKLRPPLSAEQLQKLASPSGPDAGAAAGESRRRRPDIPRDEHGLPLKEKPGTTEK
jgi:Spy/CpxP family protein refolding chaperone